MIRDVVIFRSQSYQHLKHVNAMIAKGDKSQEWERMVRWDELMLNQPHIEVSELRRIQVPVLISGADDVIKPEHLFTIYRNLPFAQLSIMPGATHDLSSE